MVRPRAERRQDTLCGNSEAANLHASVLRSRSNWMTAGGLAEMAGDAFIVGFSTAYCPFLSYCH